MWYICVFVPYPPLSSSVLTLRDLTRSLPSLSSALRLFLPLTLCFVLQVKQGEVKGLGGPSMMQKAAAAAAAAQKVRSDLEKKMLEDKMRKNEETALRNAAIEAEHKAKVN